MPRRNKRGLTDNQQMNELQDNQDLILAVLDGDIVLDISPGAVAGVAGATGWTRNVVLTLQDTEGNTHTWANLAFATTLSIGDTSTLGTASIVGTTLTFVEGVATIVVTGDAAAWVAAETDTLTVANLTINGFTVTGGTSVETFA